MNILLNAETDEIVHALVMRSVADWSEADLLSLLRRLDEGGWSVEWTAGVLDALCQRHGGDDFMDVLERVSTDDSTMADAYEAAVAAVRAGA